MKVNNLILGVLLLLMGCQSVPQTSEYVVIAGKGITVDTAWNKVAASLVAKHQATLVSYEQSIDEVMPQLKQLQSPLCGYC